MIKYRFNIFMFIFFILVTEYIYSKNLSDTVFITSITYDKYLIVLNYENNFGDSRLFVAEKGQEVYFSKIFILRMIQTGLLI